MSAKGLLLESCKAMVSKIFLPNFYSDSDFNWLKTLKVTLEGFFKRAALLKAMLIIKRATINDLFMFSLYMIL
jgi:hypothetical protein